jgi:hypothetical protein
MDHHRSRPVCNHSAFASRVLTSSMNRKRRNHTRAQGRGMSSSSTIPLREEGAL